MINVGDALEGLDQERQALMLRLNYTINTAQKSIERFVKLKKEIQSLTIKISNGKSENDLH